MVSAPAVPVSDYADTKIVFLFQISAEISCTETVTETNTETEKIRFQYFFTYYFFYSKTKQDIAKCIG